MSRDLIHFSDCEFCGRDKIIIGTPHGCYCKECLELIIAEFEEAISDLEDYEDETKVLH